MNLRVREQIKSLLTANNITMKEIAGVLTEKLGKKCTLANLSSKLKRCTLTYNGVLIIIEYMNYHVEFIKN